MNEQERHVEILSLLDYAGHTSIKELIRLFRVSEETIEKDIRHLISRGRVLRRGGAVIVSKDASDEPRHEDRSRDHAVEKDAIAREAVTRIQEGDTIILDASSTVWHLARRIPDIRLTVLTNSIPIIDTLTDRRYVRVLACSGMLSGTNHSFVGNLAKQCVEQYHADKLFMSCKSVDTELVVNDATEKQSSLKQCMIRCSETHYLLVDHTKFGTRAPYPTAGLDAFDEVITDEGTDAGFCSKIERDHVMVERVPLGLA